MEIPVSVAACRTTSVSCHPRSTGRLWAQCGDLSDPESPPTTSTLVDFDCDDGQECTSDVIGPSTCLHQRERCGNQLQRRGRGNLLGFRSVFLRRTVRPKCSGARQVVVFDENEPGRQVRGSASNEAFPACRRTLCGGRRGNLYQGFACPNLRTQLCGEGPCTTDVCGDDGCLNGFNTEPCDGKMLYLNDTVNLDCASALST